MRYVYGKREMQTLPRSQETCWLLTNGLGGYACLSASFSAARNDQGLLISARTAPSERIGLVQGLSEQIRQGERSVAISTQEFADKTPPEEGYQNLSSFTWNATPEWCYEADGFSLRRTVCMGYGENISAVRYEITNYTGEAGTLTVRPRFLCSPKGQVRRRAAAVRVQGGVVRCGGYEVYLKTDGSLRQFPVIWEQLKYEHDARDGRDWKGKVFSCLSAECTVEPGKTAVMELVFSDRPTDRTEAQVRQQFMRHRDSMPVPFRHPAARELAYSADAFVTRRDSTDGMTIVAGYPFFGDWGRDTMIALPGCVLASGRTDTAKSILRTFLAYERDGLVPNLFPEGNEPPRYNTVDAALLLINCIWLYYEKTRDADFVREAFPVMERIADAYIRGTHHGIGMDGDGLIHAGQGLDQVTWMDVCVDGILPTPRHGKPVEINAYWYNALCILAQLAPLAGIAGERYAALAERTKESFVEKFWMPDAGCLKDVISGTEADTQIRCNQIWAVTMPFTMLSAEQEKQVVQTVCRELYTPCGLRTLSPKDPEYHPTYGGSQKCRDLAYHQGTVWVFPLGAYYRAWLKVNGYSEEAAAQVRRSLESLESMLWEGCAGQLPEIYDGENPAVSRGCFAQAWSVGEILTVYDLLERIESGEVPEEKKDKTHAG